MPAIGEQGHAEILADTPPTGDPVSVTRPSAGIIVATAVMYPRLAAVIAFFSPPIAVVLLPGLGFLFTVAAAISWWEWRKIQPSYPDDLAIPAANPLQLTTALIFAAVFLAISLATAWVQ